MIGSELQEVINLLVKLPGLGPRSGRRAALFLLKHRDSMLHPLTDALTKAGEAINECHDCGNLDTRNPCSICSDYSRQTSQICVVEDVADLWALERSGSFKGRYHVLGGVLSAIDGVGPEKLRLAELVERVQRHNIDEVIMALNATVDGQTTAHYVCECLRASQVNISAIAHGIPIGGELDYLDDGTLITALKSRSAISSS